MAWIYNKKTGIVTECHNKDVINICKSDIDGFMVSDKYDTLKKHVKMLEEEGKQEENGEKSLEKMTLSELKEYAESQGIEISPSATKAELLAVLR